MILGIACWYRRYKIRQQYINEQRLNTSTVAVHYNTAMNDVNIPTSGQPTNQLPANAYPRQQMPGGYTHGPQPVVVSAPPYQPDPAVMAPPSYEDAIKQPVTNQ